MASYGASIGTGALGGAASGATIGSMTGNPYGVLIGGAIGGVAGGIGGYFSAKASEEQEAALQKAKEELAKTRREQYKMRLLGLQKAMEMYGPYGQWMQQVTGVQTPQNPFGNGSAGTNPFSKLE